MDKTNHLNQITEKVIACAIEVHRQLGPGFLESVYEAALAFEMKQAGIRFEQEKPISVVYKQVTLEVGFRCDFMVEDHIILECKAVKDFNPIHQAQLINYLKITGKPIGLLLNFYKLQMKEGIKRYVNNF